MNEVSREDKADVSSRQMHDNVIDAFKIQKKRGQRELNGKLRDEEIVRYCLLDREADEILDRAIANYNLSYRGINKVLKVARTIADLESSEKISNEHLLEALSYRKR